MATFTSTTNNPGVLGTLQSQQLYYNPNVPRQSQAAGMQGTDDRAYTRTVGNNELVENRLVNMLGRGSAFTKQAEMGAMRQAADRGLGNSSIAAGAGRKAAIESALPIASQDAATYAQAQGQNLDALNSNLMQERDIANRMLQGSRDNQTQLDLSDRNAAIAEADRRNRLLLQRENLAFTGEQNQYDRQQQFDVMGLDYSLRDMFANNQLGRDLTATGAEYEWRDRFANNQAARDNWLNDESFNRDIYGFAFRNALEQDNAVLNTQLNSAAGFFDMLNSYAMDNPDIFNSENYTQVMQFMSQQFPQIFSNILGNRGG